MLMRLLSLRLMKGRAQALGNADLPQARVAGLAGDDWAAGSVGPAWAGT